MALSEISHDDVSRSKACDPQSDSESLKGGMIDSVTGNKLKISHRTPKTCSDPEEVRVMEEFCEESGSVLANGWRLGKQLGQGLQGSVYMVEEENGKDAGTVL